MIATAEQIDMKPHSGPQEQFLASPADIAIYGGAAGGGKTYALLLEPLRHVANAAFASVIFRQTYPQIASPGGLKDESAKIYPRFGGELNETAMRWKFPSGATVQFSHMQYEKDKFAWQGAQIPLIGFDELTHFSESQFFYMLSRNRSLCGVRPYVRATCNPDAGSWVAKFIEWWIDPGSGYPIPERAGQLRWFVRLGDDIIWGESPEELATHGVPPKSVAFIPAKLEDNPTLMREDPGYRANLLALPRVERERLLGGNWKVSEDAVIDTEWFRTFERVEGGYQVLVGGTVHAVPASACRRFATIDTAGTSRDKAAEARGKPPSWSVAGIWDWWPQKDLLFLLHVWRARVGWGELKTRVPAVLREWDCHRAYVENAHSGAALKSEMTGFQVELVGPKIRGMSESGRDAKLDRAIASGVLSRIEDGMLLLPADGPAWKPEYLREWSAWTGLPDETNDQIDMSSYASHVVRRQAAAWGGIVSVGGMTRR